MPVIRAEDVAEFEVDGVRIWGLATPSRGAVEVMVWRRRIAAGYALPVTRQDHELVALVLSGSGTLTERNGDLRFGAGDVLVVSAHTLSRFAASRSTAFECVLAMPTATRHFTSTGDEMFLPWTR